MAKKRDSGIANDFLGDALKHHMDFDILLTQKIGFLVAISALVLTLTLTVFFSNKFPGFSSLLKLGVVAASIGASFCLIICLSAEGPEFIKRTRKLDALSSTSITDLSSARFFEELKKTASDGRKVMKSYSDELFILKHKVYQKEKKFTFAISTLIGSVLIAAVLAAFQLYAIIF